MGDVTLTGILKDTVAWNENLDCDLLFKSIGGTEVTQSYMRKVGIKDIAIIDTEITIQAEWESHDYN